MRYTQGQVREVVGLTTQAFRHWKKVLPNLKNKTGKTSTFSAGDILCLSIIKELTDSFNIPVSWLTQKENQIVSICNSVTWQELSESTLVIDQDEIKYIDHQRIDIDSDTPRIYLPLNSIITKIRQKVLDTQTEITQKELPFPLVDVQARAFK